MLFYIWILHFFTAVNMKWKWRMQVLTSWRAIRYMQSSPEKRKYTYIYFQGTCSTPWLFVYLRILMAVWDTTCTIYHSRAHLVSALCNVVPAAPRALAGCYHKGQTWCTHKKPLVQSGNETIPWETLVRWARVWVKAVEWKSKVGKKRSQMLRTRSTEQAMRFKTPKKHTTWARRSFILIKSVCYSTVVVLTTDLKHE